MASPGHVRRGVNEPAPTMRRAKRRARPGRCLAPDAARLAAGVALAHLAGCGGMGHGLPTRRPRLTQGRGLRPDFRRPGGRMGRGCRRRGGAGELPGGTMCPAHNRSSVAQTRLSDLALQAAGAAADPRWPHPPALDDAGAGPQDGPGAERRAACDVQLADVHQPRPLGEEPLLVPSLPATMVGATQTHGGLYEPSTNTAPDGDEFCLGGCVPPETADSGRLSGNVAVLAAGVVRNPCGRQDDDGSMAPGRAGPAPVSDDRMAPRHSPPSSRINSAIWRSLMRCQQSASSLTTRVTTKPAIVRRSSTHRPWPRVCGGSGFCATGASTDEVMRRSPELRPLTLLPCNAARSRRQ